MAQTLTFYRETLGFALIRAAPDNAPYSWAWLRSGRVELMLQTRASFLEDEPWQPLLRDRPLGGTLVLYIEMEDIDEFYEKVRDKVELVFRLTDYLYGMREFTLHDPNGYFLAFGQRIEL
jgi:uncharacterized glyoxalase superfamily protein PhnB